MTIAVLFLSLAVALLMGIPVGFSIGISTTLALLTDGSVPITIVSQKMVDGLNSFTLMALPLFVLSGAIMMYGSTPRIMNLANMALRKKRWGIGNAGILGCCAFGTISGSGVATTAAIGSIVAPEMVKKGYSKGFTASVIGAAGTLGAVIPPSIAFVVYAQIANVSISDMFMAGIVPGLLTAWTLCILNKYMVKKNNWCAGSDVEEKYAAMTGAEKRKIMLQAIPPLLMPLLILGGVLSGIVTPTEAASVATVYALILAVVVYRELNFKELMKVFTNASVTSATVLIIMSFATPFAWLMTAKNVTTSIAAWVMGISDSLIIVYGIIIFILLVLGTFMETIAIILITVPMFLPIVMQMGVNPVAYGITMCLCLGIGAVTPPLAVCLFTACRIVKIRVEETFPDVLYVCGTMLIVTVLSAIFPIISTFLPNLLR